MKNFIENKYLKWYNSIIYRSLHRTSCEYTEKHHIIPRAMGGTDENNIAILTAREHFVCHLLLTKCTIGHFRHKMIRAANALIYYRSKNRCIDPTFKISSRIYQMLKENFSEMMKGKRSDETRKRMSDAAKNRARKPLSESHKKAISEGRTGKRHDEITRKKMSASASKKYESIEARQKISEAVKNSGYIPSDKTRAKLSASISKRNMKRCVVNGKTYDSVREAAEIEKISLYLLKKNPSFAYL